MKALAWILTAAAVLVGADTFVMSSEAKAAGTSVAEQAPIALHGGSGMPTPPPDAY